jgi:hypothetical protein
MDKIDKERRRVSQSGVLDSSIRMMGQLLVSGDMNVRSLANRILADLQKLRREIPARRENDGSGKRR